MINSEEHFAEKARKAYVGLVSSGGMLFQAKHFDCLSYEDQDILEDAAKLAEVAANMVLRLLEEKDLLLDSEL